MTYSLRASLQTASGFPDERFAALLLSADPLAAKLDAARRMEVIVAALACGRTVAERLIREYGDILPSEMADMLGVKLTKADLPGKRVILSVYEPGRKEIILDRRALAHLERMMAEHCLPDLPGSFSVAEVAVAHELFHHVEDGDPAIYTRSKIITLWSIGPFHYRSTFPSAGEIAAMACAKTLCRLPFSPLLLEAVLLRASGAEHAAAWLERLEKNSLKDPPSR
jgi:hypothetical protein